MTGGGARDCPGGRPQQPLASALLSTVITAQRVDSGGTISPPRRARGRARPHPSKAGGSGSTSAEATNRVPTGTRWVKARCLGAPRGLPGPAGLRGATRRSENKGARVGGAGGVVDRADEEVEVDGEEEVQLQRVELLQGDLPDLCPVVEFGKVQNSMEGLCSQRI